MQRAPSISPRTWPGLSSGLAPAWRLAARQPAWSGHWALWLLSFPCSSDTWCAGSVVLGLTRCEGFLGRGPDSGRRAVRAVCAVGATGTYADRRKNSRPCCRYTSYWRPSARDRVGRLAGQAGGPEPGSTEPVSVIAREPTGDGDCGVAGRRA